VAKVAGTNGTGWCRSLRRWYRLTTLTISTKYPHMLRYVFCSIAAAAMCLAQEVKPAPTIPDLETTAQASYMKGDYEGARQSLQQAWIWRRTSSRQTRSATTC